MKMTIVAAFMPVNMNSDHNQPYHSPQYAVDDQVNNTLYGAHCAHTINNTTPWLTIDLDRIETLGKESFFYFKSDEIQYKMKTRKEV